MRVLVACVGNIFCSDDGFGSHVAAALADAPLPEEARLIDFGIRSVHLAYELMDGYDVLVLVDTVSQQEGPPGSLYVIEPELTASGPAPVLDPHDLAPAKVLDLVSSLGDLVSRVLVVGCQPASLNDGIGLTPPVAAAVAPAAELVRDVVSRELQRVSAAPTATRR